MAFTIILIIIIATMIVYAFNYVKINKFFRSAWVYDHFLELHWGKKLPAYSKLIHFILSAMSVKLLSLIYADSWTDKFLCFIFIMILMTGHEIWQGRKSAGQFSFKDIIANIVGGLWGML